MVPSSANVILYTLLSQQVEDDAFTHLAAVENSGTKLIMRIISTYVLTEHVQSLAILQFSFFFTCFVKHF